MARRNAETSATTGLGLSRETLVRAALGGGLLIAVVAGIAWIGGDRKAAGPLESYRRLGSTAGPVALERDLQAKFPVGSPVVPVIRHLEGQGFGCMPADATWRCSYAAPGNEPRRVWHAEVTIATEREAIGIIAARFAEDDR